MCPRSLLIRVVRAYNTRGSVIDILARHNISIEGYKAASWMNAATYIVRVTFLEVVPILFRNDKGLSVKWASLFGEVNPKIGFW